MLLLPRVYLELGWDPSGSSWFASLSSTDWKAAKQILPQAKHMVLALDRAGVPIHAGSDTMNPYVVPGASLHEELHHLVDAGLTPEEGLVAAPVTPGRFLREPGLGTIAPGAPADLVLYREDPTRDLAALTKREAVVADGRLYSQAALDAAVATNKELCARVALRPRGHGPRLVDGSEGQAGVGAELRSFLCAPRFPEAVA